MTPPSDAEQWELFKRELERAWGINLNDYKQDRLIRRVESWMNRNGISGFAELARRLRTEPGLINALQEALFINTTQFFRDENIFQELAQRILPDLLRRFGRLDVWSAACSIGAEPYTVAMLLRDLNWLYPAHEHRILGTDVDIDALRQAEAGVFSRRYLEKLPASMQHRYFRFKGDRAELVEEIRRAVTFRSHNLLRDPAPGRFHLILCRNVLIYFTAEAQRSVLARLAGALHPGGVLVVGGTESVPVVNSWGLRREAHSIFRKVEVSQSSRAG